MRSTLKGVETEVVVEMAAMVDTVAEALAAPVAMAAVTTVAMVAVAAAAATVE